jgi:hypothetical protein
MTERPGGRNGGGRLARAVDAARFRPLLRNMAVDPPPLLTILQYWFHCIRPGTLMVLRRLTERTVCGTDGFRHFRQRMHHAYAC